LAKQGGLTGRDSQLILPIKRSEVFRAPTSFEIRGPIDRLLLRETINGAAVFKLVIAAGGFI
jgi:hypothetical protein